MSTEGCTKDGNGRATNPSTGRARYLPRNYGLVGISVRNAPQEVVGKRSTGPAISLASLTHTPLLSVNATSTHAEVSQRVLFFHGGVELLSGNVILSLNRLCCPRATGGPPNPMRTGRRR
jgi:hypothetical protein